MSDSLSTLFPTCRRRDQSIQNPLFRKYRSAQLFVRSSFLASFGLAEKIRNLAQHRHDATVVGVLLVRTREFHPAIMAIRSPFDALPHPRLDERAKLAARFLKLFDANVALVELFAEIRFHILGLALMAIILVVRPPALLAFDVDA